MSHYKLKRQRIPHYFPQVITFEISKEKGSIYSNIEV